MKASKEQTKRSWRLLEAEIWTSESMEQIAFIDGEQVRIKTVKRGELAELAGKMTFWRI